MREIHGHEVNECNRAIAITADERDMDNGNTSHNYLLSVTRKDGSVDVQEIHFQHGPILEVGTNGITAEALIAVLFDYVSGFQTGKFAHRYNALALTALELAQLWLFARTLERMTRGVEGTHQL